MSVTVTRFIEIRDQEGRWHLLNWGVERSFASSNHNVFNTVEPYNKVINIYDNFSNNACTIRSYLNDQFEFYGTNFKDRGLPEDASEELKKRFADETKPGSDGYDYTYNHSYYTLKELEELYERMLDKGWEGVKREIECARSNEIIRKLDTILYRQEKMRYKLSESEDIKPILPKEEKKVEAEESNGLTYVSQTFYDTVDELIGIWGEMQTIFTFVHLVANSWSYGDDVRVTFYFS